MNDLEGQNCCNVFLNKEFVVRLSTGEAIIIFWLDLAKLQMIMGIDETVNS